MVGLVQLFGGWEGPSRGWRRNCFLLCVCLGRKKWEAGGEPWQAGSSCGRGHRLLAWLLWPAVLLPLFGESRPGMGWGQGSMPEPCRVLKPPYPAYSCRSRPAHSSWDPDAGPACATASLCPPGRSTQLAPQCALSHRRFPSSIAHWADGCRILIPTDLQQWLLSAVTPWEPAAEQQAMAVQGEGMDTARS